MFMECLQKCRFPLLTPHQATAVRSEKSLWKHNLSYFRELFVIVWIVLLCIICVIYSIQIYQLHVVLYTLKPKFVCFVLRIYMGCHSAFVRLCGTASHRSCTATASSIWNEVKKWYTSSFLRQFSWFYRACQCCQVIGSLPSKPSIVLRSVAWIKSAAQRARSQTQQLMNNCAFDLYSAILARPSAQLRRSSNRYRCAVKVTSPKRIMIVKTIIHTANRSPLSWLYFWQSYLLPFHWWQIKPLAITSIWWNMARRKKTRNEPEMKINDTYANRGVLSFSAAFRAIFIHIHWTLVSFWHTYEWHSAFCAKQITVESSNVMHFPPNQWVRFIVIQTDSILAWIRNVIFRGKYFETRSDQICLAIWPNLVWNHKLLNGISIN